MRTLAFGSLALALAGCFVSPGDRSGSTTGTSATTAANGTGATSGTGSTAAASSTSSSTGASSSGSSTGGCVVDSDCHRSGPDECNICTDMRLVCDQGACVCACQVGSSSGTSSSSGSTGSSCWGDVDCPPVAGVSQYCDIAVSECDGNLGAVTPSPGVCHRDCVDGSCTCTRDDDCPIFGCDTTRGQCNVGGVFCPNAPPCPDGCTDSHLAVVVCPFCLCSACPEPDAGGDPCGGCSAGFTCCGAQGGVVLMDGGGAGGPSYACHALEVDGGCPPGAICAESSTGMIESCNFYYP
ncbi:MAG: hypothetical protein JST54_01770 [Deltaproteobacteria bacterium]|nr:hypothetical protein [Deltaproteobacteria bacterium]